MPASTSCGSVTAASGTNTVPASNRSRSRSATATASRVLPTPPGPVSVTSRTAGPLGQRRPPRRWPAPARPARWRPPAAAAGHARPSPARCGPPPPAAAANRSLSSTARSSATSRPNSAGGRSAVRDAAFVLIRASRSASRGSRSGAGDLTYISRGSPADNWNSSSSPRSPRPARPSRSSASRCPTNTWLCARYARYSSRGGCGRAPISNITGISRSAETASRTACRSAASSPSVELTNTRSRWSGVRITPPPGTPSLTSGPSRAPTMQVCGQPAPLAIPPS